MAIYERHNTVTEKNEVVQFGIDDNIIHTL